jgi:hypothetical protein
MVPAGHAISLIFMVLILFFRPLASEGLNLTQFSALLSNLLTLFVGIMLIITSDLEDAAKRAGETFDSTERDIISLLIFIANMLVMAVPGLKLLSDGRVGVEMIATICGQFSKKDRIVKSIVCSDDQLPFQSRFISGLEGASPTAPPGAKLALSAASAFLQGDIVFSHRHSKDQRMDLGTSQV